MTEIAGYPRYERIRCPQCGSVEEANVHFWDDCPFPSLSHDCTQCGYDICESEWERVAAAERGKEEA